MEIENFRRIESAQIDFDGKSTIFFGENGLGKSSVLDALDILFSKFTMRIANPMDDIFRFNGIKNSDVTIGRKKAFLQFDIGLNANLEKEYGYYRSANLLGKKCSFIYNFSKEGFYDIWNDFMRNYVGEIVKSVEDEGESYDEGIDGLEVKRLEYNESNMPIYVKYSVHRYLNERTLRKTVFLYNYEKIDALDKKGKNSVDFSDFFCWFRARQEYENSIKVEDDSYYDSQLEAVRRAIVKVLGKEFEKVKMKINPLDFVAIKKGTELSISQLSEGEKCTLALVGDIARRLAIANPSRSNPLEGTGVVLIDEVDLHLHPKWQLKIVPLLQEIFPNIQFVVTTHSPKVLGELDDRFNIFRLNEVDDEIRIEKMKPMLGWDTNHILKEFMDTPNVSISTSKLIRAIRDNIKDENYDYAEELVDQLCKMTDGLNEEVVRARAIIDRRRRNL